jgi:hypothetical protein
MTLFRKVFQNQARPASEEEALNEKALREAFAETGPLSRPDPFAADLDEDTLGMPDDEAVMGPDGEGAKQPLRLAGPLRLPPEKSGDAGHDHDHADADWDGRAEVEALSNENWEVSTEADATLEDAVSGAAPPASGDTTGTATPLAHLAADEAVADITAVLSRVGAAEDPPTEEEPVDPPVTDRAMRALADDIADTEEHDGRVETFVETDKDPQAETEPDAAGAPLQSSPRHDVTAFAREQLQAMGEGSRATGTDFDSAPKEESAAPLDLSGGAGLDAVPAPAGGRAGRRAGRVKTRLLGFNRDEEAGTDPFGAAETTATQQREKFPVGWLVIVEGPGLGHSFSLFNGASVIGRGDDQVIKLDFGDTSISRSNHAAIAYDDEQNKFYIGHGGKSNIIRRNARPVLSTEELQHADLIRIGETTLRFVALCGSDFKWDATADGDAAGV